MKLLFITPYYKPAYVYGGPVRSISSLCEALVSMCNDVTVITTNANGKNNIVIKNEIHQSINGVSIFYGHRDIPGNYFFSRDYVKLCNNLIRRENFDLLYIASNWGFPLLPACINAYKSKIPYIISPRASFKRITWKNKFIKKAIYHFLLERKWIERSVLIHYTTQKESDDSKWLRLKPPYVIVPNPVEKIDHKNLPERGTWRYRNNISMYTKILLYLGRVEPAKGLDFAIDALSLILTKFPDCILLIAGPDEDNHSTHLLRRAIYLGIQNNVKFTGLLDSKQRLEVLVDADIFVLPSYSENFGMSVVEAMSCGLPVVISDQVGIADIVLRENAGLVTPLDPNEIYLSCLDLLQNPEKRFLLGSNAIELARYRYSPEKIANVMVNIFEEIIKKNGSTASVM